MPVLQQSLWQQHPHQQGPLRGAQAGHTTTGALWMGSPRGTKPGLLHNTDKSWKHSEQKLDVGKAPSQKRLCGQRNGSLTVLGEAEISAGTQGRILQELQDEQAVHPYLCAADSSAQPAGLGGCPGASEAPGALQGTASCGDGRTLRWQNVEQ